MNNPVFFRYLLCLSVAGSLSLFLPALPSLAQDKDNGSEQQKEFEQRLLSRSPSLPPNERQAWQLLQKMIRADLTQSFIAREIRQVAQGKETEQWIRCKPGDGFRIDGIRPDNRIILDTRDQAYIFDTRDKQWYSRSSALPMMRGIFQDVMKRLGKGELKATLDGQDTIAGRSCVIVRVAPSERSPGPSHRFWIDKSTGLRLKMEVVGTEGRIFLTSYFLSIDLTPKFRPDDFTPPTNAIPRRDNFRQPTQCFNSIAEAQQAKASVPEPRYIPTGYTLKKIEVFGPETRKPRITLRYSNGLSAISLTGFKLENVPSRFRDRFVGKPAGFMPNPQGNGERAYIWQSGANVYILLSSLPDDEVKRIADQVSDD